MDTIPITPERKAQLDGYARCHGQDAAEALYEVLAEYFACLENQKRDEDDGSFKITAPARP